jgi:hypothetical protein
MDLLVVPICIAGPLRLHLRRGSSSMPIDRRSICLHTMMKPTSMKTEIPTTMPATCAVVSGPTLDASPGSLALVDALLGGDDAVEATIVVSVVGRLVGAMLLRAASDAYEER